MSFYCLWMQYLQATCWLWLDPLSYFSYLLLCDILWFLIAVWWFWLRTAIHPYTFRPTFYLSFFMQFASQWQNSDVRYLDHGEIRCWTRRSWTENHLRPWMTLNSSRCRSLYIATYYRHVCHEISVQDISQIRLAFVCKHLWNKSLVRWGIFVSRFSVMFFVESWSEEIFFAWMEWWRNNCSNYGCPPPGTYKQSCRLGS